jgi:hypothetical protein
VPHRAGVDVFVAVMFVAVCLQRFENRRMPPAMVAFLTSSRSSMTRFPPATPRQHVEVRVHSEGKNS